MAADPKGTRLHVFGASGSGTTTLARAIASDWSVPCYDCDDFYWQPTVTPFIEKRVIEDRLRLMEEMFLPRSAWVLSGSLFSWGSSLIPYFDAVVFLSLDNAKRMQRLQEREERRYGASAISPGGAHYRKFRQFMDWNARYEDPNFSGRSRASHEKWMSDLRCPIIRVDSSHPVDGLVAQVNSELGLP